MPSVLDSTPLRSSTEWSYCFPRPVLTQHNVEAIPCSASRSRTGFYAICDISYFSFLCLYFCKWLKTVLFDHGLVESRERSEVPLLSSLELVLYEYEYALINSKITVRYIPAIICIIISRTSAFEMARP